VETRQLSPPSPPEYSDDDFQEDPDPTCWVCHDFGCPACSPQIAVTYPSDAPDAPLHPLYHQFHGQIGPQPAYLELDPEAGTLCARYSSEIGNARSEAEWHGRILTWSVPPALPAAALRQLLVDVLPLAEIVVAGYSTYQNLQGTTRGTTTEDSRDAENEIERLCEQATEDLEQAGDGGVWDAGDWLHDAATAGVTAATTDEELEALGTRLTADARHEGVTLLRLEETLEGWRDELREEQEEQDTREN